MAKARNIFLGQAAAMMGLKKCKDLKRVPTAGESAGFDAT